MAPTRTASDPIHHSGPPPTMGIKASSTGTGSTMESSPKSNRSSIEMARRNLRREDTGFDVAKEYFVGPRKLERHSKLPYFMRLSGSITPRMIVPMLFVAAWATAITLISQYHHSLAVDSLLLTVLGIVIGLGISFRTTTAYERYLEGRKYWALCSQASRDLARHIWIHAKERHDVSPEQGKEDLLAKITALNLIEAFAVSLKYKLSFKPFAFYEDLAPLISHLHVFAHDAYDCNNVNDEAIAHPKKPNMLKKVGSYLGISFAESNPRKVLKKSEKNLGNMPLEILLHLSSYLDSIIKNNTLDNGPIQSLSMTNLAQLNDVLTGTERVLNTPMPVAYSIAISQMTWIYVMALPFQLWESLGWVTIPGTVVGAYIILGIAAIGREIENPFGNDTNDLPMDDFCKQIRAELRIISSKPQFKSEDFIKKEENKPLAQMSLPAWSSRSVEDIRLILKERSSRKLDKDDPSPAEKQIGIV